MIKIYTFKALDRTRVEILWSLRSKNRDRMFDEYINQSSYIEVDSIKDCQLAIYPQRVFNPETLEFDHHVYDAIKLAQTYKKPLIIDATSDSDIFLDIPSANILRCGLYKSLQKPFETECPFWCNYRSKVQLETLEILPKQAKPRIGFCGTTASSGKLSNLAKFLTPNLLAKFFLAKGIRATKLDIRVREGMSLKLRETAIKLLAKDPRIHSNFEITNNQPSYYCNDDQNRIYLENLFIENTQKSDYVLCIRGTGNYSGRFYMALNAGCIPVVIDTDIVIPLEDKLNIVKVPMKDFTRIGDFIAEHFEKTTAADFIALKEQNRQAYYQYLTPEKFFPNFIKSIVKY